MQSLANVKSTPRVRALGFTQSHLRLKEVQVRVKVKAKAKARKVRVAAKMVPSGLLSTLRLIGSQPSKAQFLPFLAVPSAWTVGPMCI